MATYPPRRLLGARPLPSDPRRDPRRSGFPQGGGGSTRNLRFLCTHFQGLGSTSPSPPEKHTARMQLCAARRWSPHPMLSLLDVQPAAL
ncbi:uncharacterized protein LOC105238883 isoform X2 [Ailuropoda melanoleuca]|uniref:uncharacterized protein LOC105238883 isoform X2 n=1 Tax=Ailuropoda melanoleuca TaxID=9646 RepID=UPI0014949F3B|nr:uncharacterized protein LOC105238883 isoform X2 [Ailuropoda melanoleuca]